MSRVDPLSKYFHISLFYFYIRQFEISNDTTLISELNTCQLFVRYSRILDDQDLNY